MVEQNNWLNKQTNLNLLKNAEYQHDRNLLLNKFTQLISGIVLPLL